MGEAVAARGLAVARQTRARWLRVIAASRFTVRTHVLGLILVIVAPLLVFSAFLVLRSATHEQEVMANAVREHTREAAASLDHDLGALRTRLFMLAGSHSLLAGDFAALREQALDLTRPHGLSLVTQRPQRPGVGGYPGRPRSAIARLSRSRGDSPRRRHR